MRYSISVPIVEVEGYQYFEIEAASKAEALAEHLAGNSEWVADDIGIQDVDVGNMSVERIKDE